MSNSSVYYFSIPDISCEGCVAPIKSHLYAMGYTENVDIDVVSKRCKVIVRQNVLAKQILEDIIKCGKTFPNTKILTDKRTKYYEVEGLNTTEESDHLRSVFSRMNFLINDYQVNYASKAIKLELIDDASDEAVKYIFDALQKDMLLKHIKLREISLNSDQDIGQGKYKQYFKNSLINLITGAPLWVINMMGLIPTPLTLSGQLIGFGIGTLMMSTMYLTGKEFYRDAWQQFIKDRSYNMNTLIALGTGSAWVSSMLLVMMPAFFPVAALHYQFLAVSMILGIINVGRGIREYLQEKTRTKVKSIEDMFIDLQPQRANRVQVKYSNTISMTIIKEAKKDNISYKEIKKHDIIEIKPGERVPVEGVIVGIKNANRTTIDQSTLTGESKLCVMKIQSPVHSGSLNRGATIYVCATRSGKEGNLTKLIESAKKRANTNETSISSTIDKVARFFVPTIIGFSALSALGWLIWGPVPQLAYMIKASLAVMLCACPCALGLATPISTTISIYKLFKEGILVHHANVVEKVAALDAIVFDKTGTLTEPRIFSVHSGNKTWLKDDKLIKYVSSLEQAHTHHPIAHAFDDKLQDNLKLIYSKKMENGLDGILEDEEGKFVRVIVGNRTQLESNQIRLSRDYTAKAIEWEQNGYTTLYVAASRPQAAVDFDHYEKDAPQISCECVGMVALKHHIRADARLTVEALHKQGIDLYILSGDNEAATQYVAKELGIKKVFGERHSRQKADYIHYIRTGEPKYKTEDDKLREEQGADLVAKRINQNTLLGKLINISSRLTGYFKRKLPHKRERVVAMVGDGVNDIEAIEAADVGIAIGPWTDASTRSSIAVHSLSNLTTLLTISKQAMQNIRQNLWWTGAYNMLSLIAASGALYPFFGFMLNPVLASIAMACSSIFVVVNSSRLSYLIDNAVEQQKGNYEPRGIRELLLSWLSPFELVRNFKTVITLNEPTPDVGVIGSKAAAGFYPRFQTVKQEPIWIDDPQSNANQLASVQQVDIKKKRR